MSKLRDVAYQIDPALWVRQVLGVEPAAWQEQFLRFMHEQKKAVWDQLAKEKKISKDLEASIKGAIGAFQPLFKA